MPLNDATAQRLQELFVEDYGVSPLIAMDMAERVVEVLEQDRLLLDSTLRDIIVEVSSA